MKYCVLAGLTLVLVTAMAAAVDFHPDARRAFNAHWLAHPEHPEDLVRSWHDRFFHIEIKTPLLDRLVADLKRGVDASVAFVELLASPEFYVSCGSTPDGYIRRTFTECAGRAPSEAELVFWRQRMLHADRATVAHEMVTRYPPSWAVAAHPAEHFEYRTPVVKYHK
jgi:hypothetical protein